MKMVMNGEVVEAGGAAPAGSQGEIYPTEETRIGTWFDKPLYRRMFDLAFSELNNFSLPKGCVIVNIGGYLLVNQARYYLPMCRYNDDGAYGYVSLTSNLEKIIVDTSGGHAAFGGSACTLILEYTKTTDTAEAS